MQQWMEREREREKERERERELDPTIFSPLTSLTSFSFHSLCIVNALPTKQASRQAERLTLCVPYAHIHKEEGLAGKEKEANRTRSIISPRTENLKKKTGHISRKHLNCSAEEDFLILDLSTLQ